MFQGCENLGLIT